MAGVSSKVALDDLGADDEHCRSMAQNSKKWKTRRGSDAASLSGGPPAAAASRQTGERQRGNGHSQIPAAGCGVRWRATVDEDGHYSFAIALR